MIELPPRELADLFAVEKATPAISEAGRKALRARIASSVGNAPLGHAVAGTALATAGKTLAVLALVVGATTGGVAIVRQDRPPAPRIAVAPAAPTPPPAVVPAAPAAPSEIVLLQRAWAALGSGDPSHALELAHEDERVHRDGPLSEERTALEVIALAHLHRHDEALAARARFIARYPDSVHRALVQRALEDSP